MGDVTFTFRVDETLKNDFAAAAKARDRTGAQLLRDFMRSFVQQQAQATENESADEVESRAFRAGTGAQIVQDK